jgi:hypothetical protein
MRTALGDPLSSLVPLHGAWGNQAALMGVHEWLSIEQHPLTAGLFSYRSW